VVGYTLGGGIGWLARRHGLACSSVLAVEAVTADGQAVRVDADGEPDLFWALRGGGGSFAIVTALEFALYRVAEVYAGALFWPLERAGEVLHTWRELVAAAPDELTSLGRLMQFPPTPEVPEPFRGRAFVLVEAAYCGPEADGAALLQPLRELGPETDTLATIPPDGLSELHLDPPQPVPNAGDGMLLSELPLTLSTRSSALPARALARRSSRSRCGTWAARLRVPQPRTERCPQSRPGSHCTRSAWPWMRR
jgi:hypothetical protein